MKVYKIKYNQNSNIYIDKVKAKNQKEAVYIFYMNNKNADILEVKEEKDLGTN